jgi:alanyl-tRNA synthetase
MGHKLTNGKTIIICFAFNQFLLKIYNFLRHDSIGVNQEAAEELCNSLGIKFDKDGLDAEMQSIKKGFRDEVARQTLLNSETNFMAKLESFLSQCRPEKGGGICKPDLKISKEEDFPIVQWIFDEDGEPVEEVTGSVKKFWIILDKTIFIPGSKTLESDIGSIVLKDGSKLDVNQVKILPSGWILHLVSVIEDYLNSLYMFFKHLRLIAFF